MTKTVRHLCQRVALLTFVLVYINVILQLRHELLLPLNVPETFAFRSAKRPRPIWPDSRYKWDDRIVLQMEHVPGNYSENSPIKTILLYGMGREPEGRTRLLDDHCPVSRCSLTLDHSKAASADAVVFKNSFPGGFSTATRHRVPNQIWLYYQLESPNHSGGSLHSLKNFVNWTATYRSDSTIVAPYEKFVPFENLTNITPARDFTVGKTKLVAWFVSHCTTMSRREKYVGELQQYIRVDVYGTCGNLTCPRHKSDACFQTLREYKFYLAFENSKCDYYITEKLFVNAFQNAVVPVVFGARKEDYIHASPPNSFIFAGDFSSPKALADYLIQLNNDPIQYNSYLAWHGRGHFINTKFYCRLCALLHSLDTEPSYVHWYEDLDSWWNGPPGNRTCRDTSVKTDGRLSALKLARKHFSVKRKNSVMS